MTLYCLIIGRPGIDPIAVAGPFPDEDTATAEVKNYPVAWVDVLIDPANIEEARGAHSSSNH